MYRTRIFSALLAALLVTALAGCGAKQTPEQPPAAPSSEQATEAPVSEQATEAPTGEQTAADAQPPAASAAEDSAQAADDGATHVDSVEALLEAIAPDAHIVVEPGYYDLTAFLRDYPNARDQDEWDDKHPYVKLGAVYDGVEVTITDVSGLSISGGAFDPAETELVTEPRCAAVLNFENCADVELACLTLGHTETGDCSGNVLDFVGCRDIRLRTMDLYGCGVYGVGAYGCGDLTVSNSTIRDCSYGSVEISESVGDNLFTACTLSGSWGAGDYTPTAVSTLAFVGCSFGEGESTGWYFRNSAAFEDCEWSEPTSYPDRGEPLDEAYGFYPETMEQAPFDDGCLGRSCWIGYAEVNPQSGETEYFGLMGQGYKPSLLVTLDLREDGTGTLAFGTEKEDVSWEFMDGGVACQRGDGSYLYFFRYNMQLPDGAGRRDWLMMQGGGNGVIWLF